LVVTVVFSVVVILYAYVKKKIDLSAAVASGVVGVAALLMVGVEWIYLILAFFVYGNLVTRYKYKVKERYGVAEKARTYRNVFGNGGAALLFAFFYAVSIGTPCSLSDILLRWRLLPPIPLQLR